jgi:hypothetical protein
MPALNMAIRKLPWVRRSQRHGVWYIPWGRDSYGYEGALLALRLLATIDIGILLRYLDKRAFVQSTLAPPASRSDDQPTARPSFQHKLPAETAAWQLSRENQQALNRYVEQIKLKAYSASTVRTYRNEFIELLYLLKNKPVHTLTTVELRRYVVYCFEKLKLKETTLHSRINALKFYFEQVLGVKSFFGKSPGQKAFAVA